MLKDEKDISIVDNKVYLRSTKDIQTLPDCLRDTLQHQLDQLQSAKKVTQLASIIGQEFDLELLSKSYAGDDQQLNIMLNELLSANLIEVKPSAHGQTFTFTTLYCVKLHIPVFQRLRGKQYILR